ncbi:MAG: SDR family NAD(P)-dependent oxidoreductase, partial [Caulobacteraceae bacterium]|nr:SDR family NAD(P)-dependent oxidoreductase [Caulobacter sp.]
MSSSRRCAVVTGSTSGIGLAVARALAGQGLDVMLNGFGDPEAVAALRDGIAREHGVRCLHSTADMAKPAEIAAMMAEAEAALGRVDVLVNNAGIQRVSPI